MEIFLRILYSGHPERGSCPMPWGTLWQEETLLLYSGQQNTIGLSTTLWQGDAQNTVYEKNNPYEGKGNFLKNQVISIKSPEGTMRTNLGFRVILPSKKWVPLINLWGRSAARINLWGKRGGRHLRQSGGIKFKSNLPTSRRHSSGTTVC